ncbi:uncharacterized protein GGS25DRAFT_225880 [Hypoxylon fragiforme]|uniref:uncharacterized protein n=1 Tax=Hypoxylon fragiforme TaxID=63214 RepID=UPI0020C61B32|nr:uncharacterized protein GGS25DRAFT_225880 [Hypoxylon fragiforme]KAI2609669.1 hypothetical protein GGS25DRAFT_225880 [Hypoxylon fragiforme]
MTKQWEVYEDTIKNLYTENTLSVVRQTMMDRYGFKASTRAYRGRLIRWNVRKYNCRKRGEERSPSSSSARDGSGGGGGGGQRGEMGMGRQLEFGRGVGVGVGVGGGVGVGSSQSHGHLAMPGSQYGAAEAGGQALSFANDPYSASYSKSRSHLPPQQQPPPQSLPLSQPSNNVLPYGWNNNSSHSMATTLPALGNITTTNSGNNNNNTTPTTDISSNNNNTSNETLHTNTGTPSSFNASNSNSIAPPPYFRTYAHDPMAGSYYHTPPPPQQPQRGVGHHLDVTSGGSGGVGGGGMVEMAYGRPGREINWVTVGIWIGAGLFGGFGWIGMALDMVDAYLGR